MKGVRKILALAAFVATGTALASAQDIVTMKNGDTVAAKVLEIDEVSVKYRNYSSLYRASDYVWAPGDRYLPALSGVASFIIPGLGQMICGEVGRGFAFLGMTVGVPVVATVAAVAFDSYASMASCIAVGVLGCLAIDIWNIVDAVQVAKIKNMYLQDMRREYSFDMDLFPSVNCIPTSSGMQTSFGLTLAMSF